MAQNDFPYSGGVKLVTPEGDRVSRSVSEIDKHLRDGGYIQLPSGRVMGFGPPKGFSDGQGPSGSFGVQELDGTLYIAGLPINVILDPSSFTPEQRETMDTAIKMGKFPNFPQGYNVASTLLNGWVGGLESASGGQFIFSTPPLDALDPGGQRTRPTDGAGADPPDPGAGTGADPGTGDGAGPGDGAGAPPPPPGSGITPPDPNIPGGNWQIDPKQLAGILSGRAFGRTPQTDQLLNQAVLQSQGLYNKFRFAHDRQQDLVDQILGNLGGFSEATGLQRSLTDQLALLNQSEGMTPAGLAAATRKAEEPILQAAQSSEEEMNKELYRLGAIRNQYRPGSTGDIIRGIAPIRAGRDRALAASRQNIILSDQDRRLQSLLANRQIAANALGQGVNQMQVGTNLIGTVASAADPWGFLSGSQGARGLGQSAFGLGTGSEGIGVGALGALTQEQKNSLSGSLIGGLLGMGPEALDKIWGDRKLAPSGNGNGTNIWDVLNTGVGGILSGTGLTSGGENQFDRVGMRTNMRTPAYNPSDEGWLNEDLFKFN